jgi:hypothetical protein
MLNKALEIAAKAHAGQVDKGGNLYILHPLRVMITRETELERICAVLHDVVEDSDITLEDLKKEGFSEEVIRVLDCLTKREGEDYNAFIDRVLTNETACHVKLADLIDNMNLTRIPNPTAEDEERLRKYQKAADRIDEALPYADNIPNNRLIEIDGCVEVQSYITADDFSDRFIRFIENHGWFFGGGINDVTDDDKKEKVEQ